MRTEMAKSIKALTVMILKLKKTKIKTMAIKITVLVVVIRLSTEKITSAMSLSLRK